MAAPDAGDALTVFVLGASGDLAKKKTFPALFDLFLAGLLPPRAAVVGYARSQLGDAAFRDTLRPFLTAGAPAARDAFLALCSYRAGGYGDAAALGAVAAEAAAAEAARSATGRANRLFYFAIPPSVFIESAASVKAAGMVRERAGEGGRKGADDARP